MNRRRIISTLIVLVGFAQAASASRWSDPASPRPAVDPLPTLDDLLGIEGDDDGTRDPNEEALEEVLSPREAGEALGQAISLMDRVARRIAEEGDLSLPTQRLQEDILRKLDQIIASAQQNSQQGGGGSSSASGSSSSSQQPDQQQGRQQGAQSQGGANPEQAGMPGGTSEARPGDAPAPSGVSWGALPQRVRDALSQGISDRYSELYRSLTEDYYKALAEEERP